MALVFKPSGRAPPFRRSSSPSTASRRRKTLTLLAFAPFAETLASNMEPNTSSAARTSSAIADDGLPSELAQNLLPPPSSFTPPHPTILFSASDSGSGSPAAVGDSSMSIDGHAPSQSLMPSSSFFPDAGTLHMTSGGDIFTQHQLEAPPATHLPPPFAGQPWQGPAPQPSSWPAPPPGMPAYPVDGTFPEFSGGDSALLDQIAALAFFSALPGSDVPPVLPSSNYELPPLPASLRIPSPAEASSHNMSSTIVGSMIPWQCGGSAMDVAGARNFVQPSPAGLQAPLLPVKQEPVDDDTAPRRDPVFISLVAGAEGHGTPASHDRSSSYMNIDSSSMSMGANKSSSLLPMPLSSSSVSAGASSSHRNAGAVIFTDAEKEILMRDKNLQELMKTDPKKVHRTIANRIGFAKRKADKEMQTRDLERQVETMKTNCSTMAAQLLLLEKRCGKLETQNKEMTMMVQEMEQQSKQKDAVRETLQAQIETLNHMKLNNAQQMNPQMMIDENSAWGAHGLHQQEMNRLITDGSASHMNNDLHHQMSQQMVELQQLPIQAQHQQAQ